MVTVKRRELVRVMAAGKAAAAAGASPLDCPHDPNGSDDDRLRVAAWMHGYSSS